MTDEERAILQSVVDDLYGEFLNVVSQGRHMDMATLRPLADGSVFTGKQAKQKGLVDELGYSEDALAALKRPSNATTPKSLTTPRDWATVSSPPSSAKRPRTRNWRPSSCSAPWPTATGPCTSTEVNNERSTLRSLHRKEKGLFHREKEVPKETETNAKAMAEALNENVHEHFRMCLPIMRRTSEMKSSKKLRRRK